jgi:iron complex outermembrane recepter protein
MKITTSAVMSAVLVGLASSDVAFAQAQPNPPEALEEVIVTGVRASIAQGLENKREATQVVESVVAEDIGKLPDNNVIEALQRVTGVQVTNRGGGEADPGTAAGVPGAQPSGFVIRGLPDSTTTWNGRSVFTGVGRAVALQDIPANLVSRIDVFKTRAADQLETGLAGQIDVRTRRPLDLPGLEMSLNARAVTQEQRDDSLDPNVSFLASNQWDLGDGRIGALVNASYLRTRYRDQSATAGALVPFMTATGPRPPGFIPLQRIFNGNPPVWEAGLDRGLPTEEGSTLNFGGTPIPYLLARDALFASDFEGDRKRPAANLAFQWAPNDSAIYTFEAFYQGYREELFNNLHFTFVDWWEDLGPDPASTITLYPGTNLIKTRTVGNPFGFNSGDSTEQSTDTYVYALNGQWSVGDRLTLAADLAIQDSEFETQFIAVRTVRTPASITVDFNPGSGFPSWHFNDDAEMLDPARWNVGELFENAGRDEGGATTVSLDGDYALTDEGIFRTLSFGVRYDDRDATHFQPRTVPARSLPAARTLAQLPAGLTWANEDFLDGEADVPTSWVVANGYYINEHAGEVRGLYNAPVDGPPLLRSYDVQERTASAYVQLDMQFGEKLQAQAGLRYVDVSTPLQFTDLVNPLLPETSEKGEVNDVLPSATLRYQLNDQVQLRLNYGETLRRPTFADLNPNFTLVQDLTGVGFGSGTGGNPDLEAAKGKNLDFTAEWYFARDSAVYGTYFRRDIEGLVVPFVRTLTIDGTGLNTNLFRVTQPVNASDGELSGVELGFVWFPEQLPGILRGLGIQGSFTKLNSSQTIPRFNSIGDIVGEDRSEFFGVSDFSYNVTLAYDRAGLGMRLSYVRRDNFLNNNEARLFANPIGIWREPESSLDFQLNYDFNEQLAVSFDAVNLTEETQQSYYAFADAGGPDRFNFGNTLISRQFAVGVRWKFDGGRR